MNVKKIKEDIFKVQSHRDSTVWYEVDLKAKTCNCPHYQFRLKNLAGWTCKHYDNLVEYLNELIKDNEEFYKRIEDEIKKGNNYVDYNIISDRYGEKIIVEMLNFGRLIQLRKGFLSVL